MSVEEWSGGRITMPRADLTRIRHAIVAKNNALEERAYTVAKKVWDKASAKEKKDGAFLRKAIRDEITPPRRPSGGWGAYYGWGSIDEDADEAEARACALVCPSWGPGGIRPPQKQNMKLLNKSTATDFWAEDGGSVCVNTANGWVSFSTSGNHANEYAYDTWLWRTLADELDKTKWTRSSGGVITGGNEYGGHNQDDPMRGFGPVGLREAPSVTRPFTRSDGTKVTQRELDEAQAKHLRAAAKFMTAQARALRSQATELQGRDRAGRFDFKQNSAPEVSLPGNSRGETTFGRRW